MELIENKISTALYNVEAKVRLKCKIDFKFLWELLNINSYIDDCTPTSLDVYTVTGDAPSAWFDDESIFFEDEDFFKKALKTFGINLRKKYGWDVWLSTLDADINIIYDPGEDNHLLTILIDDTPMEVWELLQKYLIKLESKSDIRVVK